MNHSIFSKIRWPRPFAGLRGVTLADVPRDISAGITLAALMIPLNIGYAQVAGLPPAAGLYAAIIPLVVFALLGSAIMGVLGMIAGMQSNKIDELAAFQNFIILPLTFLSGVFYSIHSLPPFWQSLSHLNPFFYIVDGFRYGFFGVGDVSPWLSAGIVAVCLLALSMLTLWLVKTGYKMRH